MYILWVDNIIKCRKHHLHRGEYSLLKNLKTICTEVNIQQVEDIFNVGKYFPMEKIKKPLHIGVHSSGT